jgi:hypothetical protein
MKRTFIFERLGALAGRARAEWRGISLGVATLAIATPLVFFTATHSLLVHSTGAAAGAVTAGSASALSAIALTQGSFENAAEAASTDVQYLARWIAATHDNAAYDFVVIDKQNATAHVFNAAAQWTASSPILVGSALGDDSAPGIGTRPLTLVSAQDKTTPAGRFMAEVGTNMLGETVVWVDYDAAVSMHSVRNTNPSERRLQRLASPSAQAHRISYGCINFPDAFFKTQIVPRFMKRKALVYVLPDHKSIDSVFGSHDVAREFSGAIARTH